MLAFAVFWLLLLIAVAIAALSYGIRTEGSLQRAGKSRRLFRRNSQLAAPRRAKDL
jgi:hypothetical protein